MWLSLDLLTVVFAGIAAGTGVVTVVLMWRARLTARHPEITARVAANDVDGWHRCDLKIRNRIETEITVDRVAVPRGFLLAYPADKLYERPETGSAARSLHPDWHYFARAGHDPIFDKVVFVRGESLWFRRRRAIPISFSILAHDASRRSMSLTAMTNVITWQK